MSSHGHDTARLTAPGVRVWVLPRWKRLLGLCALVLVTVLFTVVAWSLLHSADGIGWFGAVWLVGVVVLVPLNLVSTLRLADRVELHPEGTMLFSAPARMLHTHVHRVRELTVRRWGESWTWVVHTDDGRITMAADLPAIGALLDLLRRSGTVVPEPPRRRRRSRRSRL